MEDSKFNERFKVGLEQQLNDDRKNYINQILENINNLSNVEKLLLYLKLPGPNGVFKRSAGRTTDAEMVATSWIQSHLTSDLGSALTKRSVFLNYRSFCTANKLAQLSMFNFGKLIRRLVHKLQFRRLGRRGEIQYSYSGIKYVKEAPVLELPDVSIKESTANASSFDEGDDAIDDPIINEVIDDPQINNVITDPTINDLKMDQINDSVSISNDATNDPMTLSSRCVCDDNIQNGASHTLCRCHTKRNVEGVIDRDQTNLLVEESAVDDLASDLSGVWNGRTGDLEEILDEVRWDCEVDKSVRSIVLDWSQKVMGDEPKFARYRDLAHYLLDKNCINGNTRDAFILISSTQKSKVDLNSLITDVPTNVIEIIPEAKTSTCSSYIPSKTKLQLEKTILERGEIKKQKLRMQEERNNNIQNNELNHSSAKKLKVDPSIPKMQPTHTSATNTSDSVKSNTSRLAKIILPKGSADATQTSASAPLQTAPIILLSPTSYSLQAQQPVIVLASPILKNISDDVAPFLPSLNPNLGSARNDSFIVFKSDYNNASSGSISKPLQTNGFNSSNLYNFSYNGVRLTLENNGKSASSEKAKVNSKILFIDNRNDKSNLNYNASNATNVVNAVNNCKLEISSNSVDKNISSTVSTLLNFGADCSNQLKNNKLNRSLAVITEKINSSKANSKLFIKSQTSQARNQTVSMILHDKLTATETIIHRLQADKRPVSKILLDKRQKANLESDQDTLNNITLFLAERIQQSNLTEASLGLTSETLLNKTPTKNTNIEVNTNNPKSLKRDCLVQNNLGQYILRGDSEAWSTEVNPTLNDTLTKMKELNSIKSSQPNELIRLLTSSDSSNRLKEALKNQSDIATYKGTLRKRNVSSNEITDNASKDKSYSKFKRKDWLTSPSFSSLNEKSVDQHYVNVSAKYYTLQQLGEAAKQRSQNAKDLNKAIYSQAAKGQESRPASAHAGAGNGLFYSEYTGDRPSTVATGNYMEDFSYIFDARADSSDSPNLLLSPANSTAVGFFPPVEITTSISGDQRLKQPLAKNVIGNIGCMNNFLNTQETKYQNNANSLNISSDYGMFVPYSSCTSADLTSQNYFAYIDSKNNLKIVDNEGKAVNYAKNSEIAFEDNEETAESLTLSLESPLTVFNTRTRHHSNEESNVSLTPAFPNQYDDDNIFGICNELNDIFQNQSIVMPNNYPKNRCKSEPTTQFPLTDFDLQYDYEVMKLSDFDGDATQDELERLNFNIPLNNHSSMNENHLPELTAFIKDEARDSNDSERFWDSCISNEPLIDNKNICN